MDTTETILTLECSLLAVFLLFIAGLIIFRIRWRNLGFNRINNGSNALSFNRKYIILPQTTAQRVQLEKNINQLTDKVPDNGGTTVDCTVIDETINRDDVGRLYFSLAYTSRILTIKLIKGENLPIISSDASKAYVKVQLISHKTDAKAPTVKKSINTNYQRTHKFRLSPNELLSHMIHFEISRFDRFSRKYDVGYVFIALAELQARGIDLCRETFFTKDITCNKKNKFETRKRRRSSNEDQFDNSQILHRVLKDSKVRQRKSQELWKKLCHAVHAGLFEERKKSQNESLQWDPFLIVQRYTEYSDSDTSQHTNGEYSLPSDQHDLANRQSDHCQRSSLQEEIPEWSPNVFNSSNESLHLSESSAQTEVSPPPCRSQETSSLNQEFYRLAHSSSFTQKESSEPITSWSIPETFRLPPETFRLPPSPVRIQARTVVFQSTSTTHTPHHDRLHKLTSLSSNYRQKILRKSRRKVRFRRSKLAGKVYLHQSLYLGMKTRHTGPSENERAYKRMRKTNHDDGKEKVN